VPEELRLYPDDLGSVYLVRPPTWMSAPCIWLSDAFLPCSDFPVECGIPFPIFGFFCLNIFPSGDCQPVLTVFSLFTTQSRSTFPPPFHFFFRPTKPGTPLALFQVPEHFPQSSSCLPPFSPSVLNTRGRLVPFRIRVSQPFSDLLDS